MSTGAMHEVLTFRNAVSSWPKRRFGELISSADYGTSQKPTDHADGIPIIRMGNVTYNGEIDLKNLKYLGNINSISPEFMLKRGDLLFNRTNSIPLVGKMGIWNGDYDAVAASYFIRVRVQENLIIPKFAWHYFNCPMMKRNLRGVARGAIGQANINSKELRNFEVPVPSLLEQRRIVDILDRAGKIRRLRQQAQDTARLIIPALFNKMFGDPLRNSRGWKAAPLGDVADVSSGITKGRNFDGVETVEVPYLRVANVQDGHLDLSDMKQIVIRPSEMERFRLAPGDLLMTEGGDPDKLGRGALWAGQMPYCAHQNHVFRVRANAAYVLPRFLTTLTSSAYGKAYFFRVAKRTTGIASINKTQLSAFPVLLPPIRLQQEFERLAMKAERLGEGQDKAEATAAAAVAAVQASIFG